METVDLKFIDSVLEKHGGDKAKIIAIMQDVQEEYRYLPQDALANASTDGLLDAANLPLANVSAVRLPGCSTKPCASFRK